MKKELIAGLSILLTVLILPILAGADEVDDELAIITYSEIDDTPVLDGMYARGSLSDPQPVSAGYTLFKIRTFGWSADVDDFSGPTATIMFEAAEDFDGTGGLGTNIRFWTTDIGDTEDEERMRIEPDGRVGIGTRFPSGNLEVSSVDGGPVRLNVTTYNNRGTGSIITGRRARGSNDDPAAVQEGDRLLTLSSRGYGDDDFGGSTAYINLVATENFTNTEKGTAISFGTTPNGATDRDERMRIDHNGNVGIGTENPQSTLQVNGYVQLALTNGAPPLEDCDEPQEYGRMNVDPYDSCLYICVADGWKPIKHKTKD